MVIYIDHFEVIRTGGRKKRTSLLDKPLFIPISYNFVARVMSSIYTRVMSSIYNCPTFSYPNFLNPILWGEAHEIQESVEKILRHSILVSG